jgi:hypothetical protein
VEPEELGFVMDVHMFLGKEMEVSGSTSPTPETAESSTYTLQTMQPR